jgi:outer membrane protein
MKKYLILVGLITVLSFTTHTTVAQAKIGYISLQELVNIMPEYKKAQADLADYQRALASQADEYQREFNAKDSIFKVMSQTWTPAMVEVKKKELDELYARVNKFTQDANQQLQQKEQTLLIPIQQKAVQTTQAVAKENGYTYVLSKEQLISFPPGDDLLQLVAKKLNLKIEPQKPAGNIPPTPKTGGQ